ncbi:NAD(P)/FAD-dependent oxidoreductase [Kineosporia succinea]|uniref:NADPH-dependent 2,4-dienoyl-CoA reductase/sulfur reductase-like enzyme n=1 Tax=Kineosporia succinea TaxID=84632 RepID=A0ABT9P2I4_9ACTN|nr:NAD(P)/FAD-dependent oxidoreductase [Kineosporia succinea]MDP9826712.1 NADPH-dependent 2,4-dienoyl-CoA reductase/sulfur reductase-like enzyme [Kineosporia succinea]
MTDEVVDLLVIGGGPAGLSAVRAYREEGGKGRVMLVSADPDSPYDRPPLSKDFLRGDASEDDLGLLEDGELSRLEVTWARDRVTAVDVAARHVGTREGAGFTYRTLVLATGANPLPLPVPGGDDASVLRLRTLADSKRLREAVGSARTVAVIGSGFIGCEAASSLRRLGLEVVQITNEDAPQEKRLGAEAGARIAGWLEADGVRLITGATVTAIEGGTVRLRDGDDVTADVVLTAVGVQPASQLAAEAGLSLHEGRVVVDAHMRTSADGVLAAGDVVHAFNTAAGRALSVEHWFDAETMGKIAGRTAAGVDDAEWSDPPGFWSQIGDRWLKYAAWGDGYAQARFEAGAGDAFTVWYHDENGAVVGALTYEADENYDKAFSLLG